jgi:hypothetical protein
MSGYRDTMSAPTTAAEIAETSATGPERKVSAVSSGKPVEAYMASWTPAPRTVTAQRLEATTLCHLTMRRSLLRRPARGKVPSRTCWCGQPPARSR